MPYIPEYNYPGLKLFETIRGNCCNLLRFNPVSDRIYHARQILS